MLGYFGASIIQQTAMDYTGSLTCVCDRFACVSVHTGDLGLWSHPEGFRRVCRRIWLRRNPRAGAKRPSTWRPLTRPFGDHAFVSRSGLTWALQSERLLLLCAPHSVTVSVLPAHHTQCDSLPNKATCCSICTEARWLIRDGDGGEGGGGGGREKKWVAARPRAPIRRPRRLLTTARTMLRQWPGTSVA